MLLLPGTCRSALAFVAHLAMPAVPVVGASNVACALQLMYIRQIDLVGHQQWPSMQPLSCRFGPVSCGLRPYSRTFLCTLTLIVIGTSQSAMLSLAMLSFKHTVPEAWPLAGGVNTG